MNRAPERGVHGDRLILGLGAELDEVEPAFPDDPFEMRVREQGDVMAASAQCSSESDEWEHVARGARA